MSRPEDILAQALDIAHKLESRPVNAPTDWALVALHHLVVAIRDAEGVRQLCTQGLSDVALLVVRRLWEDAVRLSYIQKDPDQRSRDFMEEAWVDATRTLEKAVRKGQQAGAPAVAKGIQEDPRFEIRRRELEALKPNISSKAQSRATADRPSTLWRIGEMARDVGLGHQYDFLYHFLSQRTHAGVDAAKDYFKENRSGQFRRNETDYSFMALGLTATWLLYIAQVYAEAAEHPDDVADIEKLLEQLKGES